ncbi:hypothetical protein TNCT_16311 [Trichonephila clavata]|uniref:Uncharacterized protein n=1 Tax=Trichonephila clavata TaxID=2740835 RepID=A0A8X6FWZ0_TRICU|nr:hypothetical protein TNCT_539721 [Trichonephila clavata]GFQ97524.1 hypothetical protein TNCT_16311 [Trichonephila clavata]
MEQIAEIPPVHHSHLEKVTPIVCVSGVREACLCVDHNGVVINTTACFQARKGCSQNEEFKSSQEYSTSLRVIQYSHH